MSDCFCRIILDGNLDEQFHAACAASFQAPSNFQRHLAGWERLLPYIADSTIREQLRSDITHGLDTYWEGDAARLPQVARHFFRNRREERCNHQGPHQRTPLWPYHRQRDSAPRALQLPGGS